MSSLFQNSYYVLNSINAILYGMEIVLYFLCLHLFFRKEHQRTSMDTYLIILSTVLLILITIYWTTQAYFGEMMWIIHTDYPGGADAYATDFASVWYQTWGTTACVLSNMLSDALLIYRCYVIWNSLRVVALPAVNWCLNLGLGIALLVVTGQPSGNYFHGVAVVTAYTATTIAFNIIVTGLIAGRILYVARTCAHPEDMRMYTSTAAIIIESALPFTIFSIAYVITYGMGSDIASAFSWYAMFTCISPQLIILRVLMRTAWTKDSAGALFTSTFHATEPPKASPAETIQMSFIGTSSQKDELLSPSKETSVHVDLRVV